MVLRYFKHNASVKTNIILLPKLRCHTIIDLVRQVIVYFANNDNNGLFMVMLAERFCVN